MLELGLEKCKFHLLSLLTNLFFISMVLEILVSYRWRHQQQLMSTCISITFDALFCKYYSFLRTLLSLVLIRNLGMKSDYVLFRNLCNSNLCPFGIQTCCQSMKNPKKQLGLSFEDFFFFCRIPGLSQRERWLWENKEMAIVSKWQMLFQSRCQSTSAFQSYTVLYYCPLLSISAI